MQFQGWDSSCVSCQASCKSGLGLSLGLGLKLGLGLGLGLVRVLYRQSLPPPRAP